MPRQERKYGGRSTSTRDNRDDIQAGVDTGKPHRYVELIKQKLGSDRADASKSGLELGILEPSSCGNNVVSRVNSASGDADTDLHNHGYNSHQIRGRIGPERSGPCGFHGTGRQKKPLRPLRISHPSSNADSSGRNSTLETPSTRVGYYCDTLTASPEQISPAQFDGRGLRLQLSPARQEIGLSSRHLPPVEIRRRNSGLEPSPLKEAERMNRFHLPSIPSLRSASSLHSPSLSAGPSTYSLSSQMVWIEGFLNGGRQSYRPPQFASEAIFPNPGTLTTASCIPSPTLPPPTRLSSIYTWPQFIFPTPAHDTTPFSCSLETPYAFSHLPNPRFHWTRADALLDHRWNMWARPPCLNCIVHDLSQTQTHQPLTPNRFHGLTNLTTCKASRGCDRWVRQNDSEGTIRCCSRCARTGAADSCVETIEVRDDGKASYEFLRWGRGADEDGWTSYEFVRWGRGTDEDRWATSAFDRAIWSAKEVRLRQEGVVWWVPINLGCEDVEGKEAVVERWREMGGGGRMRENGVVGLSRRKAKERAKAQVGEWDEEEKVGLLQAETKLAIVHSNEPKMWIGTEEHQEHQEHTRDDDRPEEGKQNNGKVCEVDEERQKNDRDQQNLDEEVDYWKNRLSVERYEAYEREVEQIGQLGAWVREKEWTTIEAEVLKGVANVVGIRAMSKSGGWSRMELEAAWQGVVGPEVRKWIDRLVPGIWLRD